MRAEEAGDDRALPESVRLGFGGWRDLEHDVGLIQKPARIGDDLHSDVLVGRIGEAGRLSRPRLDGDRHVIREQTLGPVRREGDPRLAGGGLPRDTDSNAQGRLPSSTVLIHDLAACATRIAAQGSDAWPRSGRES